MKKYILLGTFLLNIPLQSVVVKIVDYSHFEKVVLKSKKPVILNFTWSECSACIQTKIPFQELAQNSLFNNVVFAEVDIAQHPDIAKLYSIVGVPTFLYIQNNKVLHQETGVNVSSFADDMSTKIHQYFFQSKEVSTGIGNILHRTYTNVMQALKNFWNRTSSRIKGWLGW